MKFNCVAVDDDLANLQQISQYMDEVGRHKLLTFTDPLHAVSSINKMGSLDFLFLDIEMPNMSGLEVLLNLRAKIRHVVITTAHDKYAAGALKLQADAFLIKPYSVAKFLKVLTTLNPLFCSNDDAGKDIHDHFFIKSKNEKSNLVKVKFEDIVAIESEQSYITIYTLNRTIISHISLSRIKHLLMNQRQFIQIHRSFIISTNYLEEIHNAFVVMSNKLQLAIGDSYRSDFFNLLSDRIIKTGRNHQYLY